MADHLPDEITTEILTRLPAKSVFVFRSVCTTWCDIIDDPRFPSMHLNRGRETPSSTFIYFSNYGNAYILNRDKSNPEFFQTTMIKIHSLPPNAPIFYKRYANGLLSFNNGNTYDSPLTTQIFNPITGDLIQLPAFPKSLSYVNFGFSVDSWTGEHKVVYLLFSVYSMYEKIEKMDVRVFTVGSSSNSWRVLENVPDIVGKGNSIASVNGSFHWFTTENIVRLDLASEKFTTIEHPPLAVNDIDILNMPGFLTLVASSSMC